MEKGNGLSSPAAATPSRKFILEIVRIEEDPEATTRMSVKEALDEMVAETTEIPVTAGIVMYPSAAIAT
jgi:hypothetical protein